MPLRDTSVKIIKRKERVGLSDPEDMSESQMKTPNQSRRELIQTVTSWIKERRETKQVPKCF